MGSWSAKRLGNLCLRVSSGGTPLRSVPEYYENGTIPWLKTGEIKKGLIYDTEEKITENGLENSSTKLIPVNSVIVAMYGDGDTAGNVAINKVPLTTNQACCNFTLNPEQAHYRFIYYYLKGSYSNLINLKLGGSQQNLNAQSLKNFAINHPRVETQKRIAAILSAYDELIENNQRRITLLGKLAEEIYREWFVRMRFPGHEKVKKLKGVPEGWQITELKDVAIEASRSTRPGSHLAERLYLPLELFNTRQMIPGGHQNYTEAQSSLVTFEKDDILFGAMRPYQHKVAMAPFAGITRTTCFVIRPKMPQAWSWLFLTLFQQPSVDYATMICNGADRPYVVWNKGMERMKLLRPDDALLAKFEGVARPILDSISSMYFVQLKLKDCRDKLLPRLISGKLSVENLDIQFPPGMAEVQLQVA